MQSFVRTVGLDWGSQTHQVCRTDASGLTQRAFPHSGEGIEALVAWIGEGLEPGQIGVAIETPRGPLVDVLGSRGFQVFAINPKTLDRLRDRFFPAGSKDDRKDAFVLASTLATDRAAFAPVHSSEETARIRQLVRLSTEFKEDRRRLTNRLWNELNASFPALLSIVPAADEPWLWALLERAASPEQAARLRRTTIDTLLKSHRVRRLTADQVLQVLRQKPLPLSIGVVELAAERIAFLIPKVVLANRQAHCIEARLAKEIGDRIETETESIENRDIAILASLPGVGPLTLATTIAEAGEAVERRDVNALRSMAGVAPVTRQSGKSRVVKMRHACKPVLRDVFFNASFRAIQLDSRFRQL